MKRRLFQLSLSTIALSGLIIPGFAHADDACPNGVELSIKVSSNGSNCLTATNQNGGIIVAYLEQIIKFLTGGIGIVLVLMMVVAGIQYITSVGDPSAVKKAKERMRNALTGLLLFIFAAAILNFIIPGGILG